MPDWLRSRWQLHIGDVAAILPGLRRELGEVDMFIHDSLHTYEHMKFEFELARPYIKHGGLLLADDALWNSAFNEFAQVIHSQKYAIIRGVVFLRT